MLYITSVMLLTGSLYLLTTFIQFPASHFTNVYLIVEDRVITVKRRQPWQLKSCSCLFQTKIQLLSTVIWSRDAQSKVRVTFKRVERATGWGEVFFKGKQSSDPLILSFLMTARRKVKQLSLSSHMTTYEDPDLLNMVGVVLLNYTCTSDCHFPEIINVSGITMCFFSLVKFSRCRA